ncbi:hypothetical protein BKA67DRAFT_581456 [Truncatella angustata]|uniref:Secreted protein n=1 Tax=Truncatella angustata TaxID=152316 RepID=A0A9P8UDA7_9PEZI|nr:uncharacterized protein BKA67DRAFT_581456 [Truncatella angustata]KAH6647032.1 hypothetical protein BKA67DRAFT_581456 [Truncatella angustata]
MCVAPLIFQSLAVLVLQSHLFVQLSDLFIPTLDFLSCTSSAQKWLHLNKKLPPWILTKIEVNIKVALNNASRFGTVQSFVSRAALDITSRH